MVVELYPEQQEAVDKLGNGKVLFGDVGSGKTITSLVYFYTKVCGGVVGDLGSIKIPKNLIVITTARKRDSFDWQTDAAKLCITDDPTASVAGITITVDSWNNIDKYKDVKDSFFIFDEQRLVGSGAWTKAFVTIAKHNQWILLTATPGDTWIDYIPLFVANGYYKNRTEFKRRHVVYTYHTKFPKVERYLEVGVLVRLRDRLLVEMPVIRHTTRHFHEVPVEYDAEMFEKVVKKRWHVYEERPIRDVAELFGVMRKVANSNASRLEAVRELMEKHPRLIVFYNFDYELEMLRQLGQTVAAESSSTASTSPSMVSTPSAEGSDSDSPSSKALRLVKSPTQSAPTTATGPTFALAEWNGHKHEQIPQTDRWVYLVQYVAGAEAWNCTETNAVCFYSLTYSYKNFYQAQGRIDRLDTPFFDLHYYILMSRSAIDRAVAKALRGKKSFNEKDFGVKFAA